MLDGGFDDFAVLEFQPHILEFRPGINRGRVVLDAALHGVLDGTTEHFAVGDVAPAVRQERADALDAEPRDRCPAT